MLALALAHMLRNQILFLTCVACFLRLFHLPFNFLPAMLMSHTPNFNSYANFYLSHMLFAPSLCTLSNSPLSYLASLSCIPVLNLTMNHYTNSYANLCYLSFMFVTLLLCNFQAQTLVVFYACLAPYKQPYHQCYLSCLIVAPVLYVKQNVISHLTSSSCMFEHLTPFSCLLILNQTDIDLNVCLSSLFTFQLNLNMNPN